MARFSSMALALAVVVGNVWIYTPGVMVNALSNGLARTPQMGWDNWNAFGCSVDEDLLISSGQSMIDYGLRDLGYTYIILDDCWSSGRNASGHLQEDTSKFPNGMKYVADRLHEMGLKFGMYSDAGTMTCAQFAGSLGFEVQDAQTFASWDVDYLKYDNCFNEGQSGTPLITYNRYKVMSDALSSTGRPILYSMCNWGEDYPWKWAQTVANSWRMSGDIFDTFDRPDPRCPCSGDEGIDCALPGWHCSAMNILNKVAAFPDKGSPGAWNDMDMLEVGNGGMTDNEYITHFSMWAALKSPLIIGTDVRRLTPSSLSIYSNPAVLAISQDPAGNAAVRRWRYYVNDTDEYGQGEIQMWSGGLGNGDMLVVLVNAGDGGREMNATLGDVFWDSGPGGTAAQINKAWAVYDLWGDRMDNETANAILRGEGTTEEQDARYRYNATEMGGYAEGISQNVSVLFGKRVGVVGPGAEERLRAWVGRHGVGMFRLREEGGEGSARRDELCIGCHESSPDAGQNVLQLPVDAKDGLSVHSELRHTEL